MVSQNPFLRTFQIAILVIASQIGMMPCTARSDVFDELEAVYANDVQAVREDILAWGEKGLSPDEREEALRTFDEEGVVAATIPKRFRDLFIGRRRAHLRKLKSLARQDGVNADAINARIQELEDQATITPRPGTYEVYLPLYKNVPNRLYTMSVRDEDTIEVEAGMDRSTNLVFTNGRLTRKDRQDSTFSGILQTRFIDDPAQKVRGGLCELDVIDEKHLEGFQMLHRWSGRDGEDLGKQRLQVKWTWVGP